MAFIFVLLQQNNNLFNGGVGHPFIEYKANAQITGEQV